MDSKNKRKSIRIVALVITCIICACGGSPGGYPSSSGVGTVGSAINQSPATWRFFTVNGERVFYGYDFFVQRINRVSLNAAQVQSSSRLSVPAQTDSWFAGPDGKIFFTIEDKNLALLNPDTSISTPVHTFGGKIISVAADAVQGLYAFVDEYSAVTLLSLNSSGGVENKWTGGPVLGAGIAIRAGDILPGGKLLVAGNSGKIAIIDIRQSIAKGGWEFKSLQWQGSDEINFAAPIPGRPDRALLGGAKGLYLINVETAESLDAETPAASFSIQKVGRPHLRYLDVATDTWKLVTYDDGDKLRRKDLPNASSLRLTTDVQLVYLSDKYLNVVTARSGTRSRRVFTVRLSDALVEKSVDISESTVIGLGEDEFSAMDDSPLGSMSVYSLRSEVTKSFKGYNRELLQTE